MSNPTNAVKVVESIQRSIKTYRLGQSETQQMVDDTLEMHPRPATPRMGTEAMPTRGVPATEVIDKSHFSIMRALGRLLFVVECIGIMMLTAWPLAYFLADDYGYDLFSEVKPDAAIAAMILVALWCIVQLSKHPAP